MKKISREQAELLFREHSANVYRVALFLTKSPTLADDITQDTFLQVFCKYDSYNPNRPIKPWIYKIALNTARNALRKQKLIHLFKEEPEQNAAYIEEHILKNEFAEELWNEINRLPLKSREIIVMHYYADLKLNEIAAALNIPLGTCKSRLNTALNILEKKMPKNSTVILSKGEDVYGTIPF